MDVIKLSGKGQELIRLYEKMASSGYERTDGSRVESAFNDFEMRKFRFIVEPILKQFKIRTLLDYGCGGSDWNLPGFDEETLKSAVDYFGLSKVFRYEPARNLDERQRVDCVASCDVLEHVFISDVPAVLRDLFEHAETLLVLNVACYKAAAKLPNGENAHVTVRTPEWWKGMVDSISIQYPNVNVVLMCSETYLGVQLYETWSAKGWETDSDFELDLPEAQRLGEQKNNVTASPEQILSLVEALTNAMPDKIVDLQRVLDSKRTQ